MKISVIVPLYNGERYIRKCLDSLKKQSLKDIEVIVIDDGSTDNGATYVKKIVTSDSRFQYIYQTNQGPGVARNTGILEAKGEYLVFVDSDDWVDEHFCEIIYKKAIETKSDIIYFNYYETNINGTYIKENRLSDFQELSKERLQNSQLTGKFSWAARTRAVRREIVSKHNIFFSTFRNAEELIFSHKILEYSKTITFIDTPIYYYLVREDSQSKQKEASYALEKVYSEIKREIKAMGDEKRFEASVNGLVMSAYIIRIYGLTQEKDFIFNRNSAKNIYKEFKTKYDGKTYESEYLERRVRILSRLFLKGHTTFILILGYIYRLLDKRRIGHIK